MGLSSYLLQFLPSIARDNPSSRLPQARLDYKAVLRHQVVLLRLAKLLGDEYTLQREVKDEIQYLHRELESMQLALQKVSEVLADQLDPQAKLWARNLKDMSYCIQDTIDSYMLRVDDTGESGSSTTCCINLKSMLPRICKDRHDIATEVKRIKKEVEEISSRHERYKVDGMAGAAPSPHSPAQTSSKENASTVTVDGTSPCNSIWENTSILNKLNETMHNLNIDIRRCFEFCSIFPKGFQLRRDELVRLWIAQGFVKTSCATDDLEDMAEGYIEELVSCSFLQTIGTQSDTDCFIIHDDLHDILDKVPGNCFRIENHRGKGWEGDVPRHIQHLFIQDYDGELITETIIGLEYLRTLIVYFVARGTPVKEKVIENICKSLPNLRVLAIAFNKELHPIKQLILTVPKCIGQLKYLHYLAFRTTNSCKITLPSTLNKLQRIQLLDFGDGEISEFTFTELVNLRHIFCSQFFKLPYVGRLRSLQTLPGFRVSNEQGCELTELKDLKKLRGELWIRGLENVKSKGQALQANLAVKRLTNLTLEWGYTVHGGYNPEVAADVFEGLCPPVGLKKLTLRNFEGWRYPDWTVGKHIGGPKYLQELHIVGCSQSVAPSGLAEAFPHVCMLWLGGCSWDTLPVNMEHLQSLKQLWIISCQYIRSVPSLPQSLDEFTLKGCNAEFMKSCQTAGQPNWQKIEHIPKKNFFANPFANI